VVLIALCTYAHPFGIFVFAGHVLVAFVVAYLRQRAGSSAAPTPGQVFGVAVAASLAILTLFAPLVVDAVRYAVGEANTAGHGPRVWALLPELFAGLRQGFGGWPGIMVGAVVGTAGTIMFLRRQPVTFALLTAPLVVSAVAVLGLGAGVHPRYFLLALPLGYLVATYGVLLVVRWVVEQLVQSSSRSPKPLIVATAVVLVVVACAPLARYYRTPKQDYVGGMKALSELAGADDRIVAAAHAGRAMKLYYDPEFPVADNLEELEAIEAGGRRVWVMVTLEREMASSRAALLDHLHSEYERVRYLPGTIGDGAVRIYVRRLPD